MRSLSLKSGRGPQEIRSRNLLKRESQRVIKNLIQNRKRRDLDGAKLIRKLNQNAGIGI